MRGRHCNKLATVCFVLGIFAMGVLCGIYYEAVSARTHAGVRAAETRNVNGAGPDGQANRNHQLKAQPGKDNKLVMPGGADTKPKSKEPVKVDVKNSHVKTEAQNKRRGDVQQDVGNEARGKPVDEHQALIQRKEFGQPIRLMPNAPVPPQAKLDGQANVVLQQQQQKQQQPQQQQQQQPKQPQLQQPDVHQLQQQLQQRQQQQQQQPKQPQLQQPDVRQLQQQLQQRRQQQQQQQPKQPQPQQPQFADQGQAPQRQNAQQQQVPQQQPQQQQQQQQLNNQAANQKPQPNIPSANQHVAQPAPMPAAAMPGVKPAVVAQDQNKNSKDQLVSEPIPKVDGKIAVSVVICGDRTDEALMMVKSAVLLTPSTVHFHIFAEEELQENIIAKLKAWPQPYSTKMTYNLHNIAFPPGENVEEWKKMFKKCATQRLFLPDLLVDTDALLYVDTDILFTKPLEYIWSFFKKFNSTQLAALTPEHEVTNIGWYNRFARHPFYGPTGLNSGVMLMNLTRMRAFGWSAKILPIYREYKLKTTWGDQDLLNILFHFHPELVYVYQCEWNVRPDHCMYSLNCHRIEKEGVAVIHGNRGVYHNEKQLPFRIIYEAFRDYQFGTDLCSGLVQPLKQRFTQADVASMYCTKGLQHPLMATLQKYCKQQ